MTEEFIRGFAEGEAAGIKKGRAEAFSLMRSKFGRRAADGACACLEKIDKWVEEQLKGDEERE